MGKGSHDPKADEPAKLVSRTLTMKRSASRDLLGDALDCAASCIDAAALDAYRLDYASSESRRPLSGHFFTLRSRRRHAVSASSACLRARRATEKTKIAANSHTRATPAAASSAAQLHRLVYIALRNRAEEACH